MRIGPVVDQLRKGGARHVGGALELAALKSAPGRLPAFYVTPESEDATPNQVSGAHRQRTGLRFGVVIMIAGHAAGDEKVSEELHELETLAIRAIAGWTHPDCANACDYAGARPLGIVNNVFSWLVSFRTGRIISA